MRKILTSCALCVLAFSASAQCLLDAHAPAAQHDRSSGWIKTANAGTAAPDLGDRSHGAMVKVAARDASAMQQAAAVGEHKTDAVSGEEHRRRSGPAMLIAVLAVMSAIALRRIGASDR